MANLNKEIKDAMNETMPSESVFSEFEKQQVLNRIKNNIVPKRKKKKNIIPNTLTAAALAGSILFVGGIAGTNLGLLGGNTGDESKMEQDLAGFYPDLSVGEVLNGWELIQKGSDTDMLIAEFKGGAQITGTLKYFDENDEKYPGKLLFTPDQLSLNSIPVMDGNYPDLAFSNEDQQYIQKIFGISGEGNLPNITIKVDSYTATYKNGQTIPDEVGLKDVIFPDTVKDEIVVNPFEIMKNSKGELILSEDLLNIFTQFAASKDDSVLAGLTPAEVFQLYFYAEEIEDYETQYSLFIDDEQYVKVFPTYEDYFEAKTNPPFPVTGETLLEKVKRMSLNERIINENTASVAMSSEEEEVGFGLNKNSRGIWRVNWTPTQ